MLQTLAIIWRGEVYKHLPLTCEREREGGREREVVREGVVNKESSTSYSLKEWWIRQKGLQSWFMAVGPTFQQPQMDLFLLGVSKLDNLRGQKTGPKFFLRKKKKTVCISHFWMSLQLSRLPWSSTFSWGYCIEETKGLHWAYSHLKKKFKLVWCNVP